jgi:Rod binding domain-containing protein
MPAPYPLPPPAGARAAAAAKPEAGRAALDPAREAALRETARAFEASFLAEMLGHAGVGASAPGFDGGPGEEAFRGMMVAEQARLMTEAGGIGLAETIFQAMLKQETRR